ncbi:CRIB domain-containing protein RIC6-like [Diospyros lotus]|uniref:CRIB domain-containing protein RIC6-like n=1 Tax=Diospyros lotus TaxID=55363 RepID=UPI0022549606|nr:CRIB domain-containing protein RIC6-like [Diospyros lotus]XP_052184708.1 CRIB domain-containing protein RIC6-like [Diospyros lotus]XP_052184709.1 CRIB domain-containing protein RIC6-like [Diospyros lotus]
MGTNKMKGVLKGLRYITQIFDEDKEPEMQIGFPTDVKHVAHIGWDGPSVDSPSWMKEFDATAPQGAQGFQSAPLNANGEPINSEEDIKWVSEGSGRKGSLKAQDSANKEPSQKPKTTRRHSSAGGSPTPGSPKRDPSGKSGRASRKNSSEGSKSTRHKDSEALPDIPKKSHRKKPKDLGGSSKSSRSKQGPPAPDGQPLPGSESNGGLVSQNSSSRPPVEEDKG